MSLDAIRILEEGYENVISNIGGFVEGLSTPQIALGTAGVGVVVGSGAVGIVSAVRKKVTKKRKKVTKKKKKTKKRKLKFGSKAYRKKYLKKGRRRRTPLQKRRRKIISRKGRQTPYTARGGKDRSTRRIRHTKHGQPYIILRSGKARFIKKSSAKRSRKMKGGRY